MKNYGRNSKDIQEKSCFISDKVVSLHSRNLRSPTLNRHSSTLNRRSSTLNGHSASVNGDFS